MITAPIEARTLTPPISQTPTQAPQISEQIVQLQSTIKDLTVWFEQFEQRLSPILKPILPPQKEEECKVLPEAAPLAQILRTEVINLRKLMEDAEILSQHLAI